MQFLDIFCCIYLTGKDCTFEKMDEVRERQERLARLHFDLDSHQESKRWWVGHFLVNFHFRSLHTSFLWYVLFKRSMSAFYVGLFPPQIFILNLFVNSVVLLIPSCFPITLKFLLSLLNLGEEPEQWMVVVEEEDLQNHGRTTSRNGQACRCQHWCASRMTEVYGRSSQRMHLSSTPTKPGCHGY